MDTCGNANYDQICQIWYLRRIFGSAKYGQVRCPWKDLAKCSSGALTLRYKGLPVKSYDKLNFWPISPSHLIYENQWGKLHTKIQTFGFWDTLIDTPAFLVFEIKIAWSYNVWKTYTYKSVVKHLLQRIRDQGWKNNQYEKYILGGKEYMQYSAWSPRLWQKSDQAPDFNVIIGNWKNHYPN